jgi:DNA-binding NarL/FixJ family response regulator
VAVEVAVVDPLPLFRDGAVAALSAAGHLVQTPGDVLAWAQRATTAVILLTLQGDGDWQLLHRLCDARPSHPVIVLLGVDGAAAGVRAVRAGARSVMSRQVTAKMLQRTVAATIEGQAVLPADVAVALTIGGQVPDGATIPEEKLTWLRALAAGTTVVELARRRGYSERVMYRLLRSLYRDMGVHGRLDALMQARDRGWI